MKKLIILSGIWVLLFLPSVVLAVTITTTVTHKYKGALYFIEFSYDDRIASVPAVEGAVLHYSATITIRKVIKLDGKTGLVCRPFKGMYTGGKCYEDNPDDLVKYCIERRAAEDD